MLNTTSTVLSAPSDSYLDRNLPWLVSAHIRNLHVSWLNVIRYDHLQCENLGIHTIAQMLDAGPDDLRVLFLGENDNHELDAAVRVLITRFPEPFDVGSAQWADVAVELARVSSAITARTK